MTLKWFPLKEYNCCSAHPHFCYHTSWITQEPDYGRCWIIWGEAGMQFLSDCRWGIYCGHQWATLLTCICLSLCIKLLLCPLGVRKDRSRVLRHTKRRTGTSDRIKASKDLEHRTATPQDGRKHSSSSGACGGGKSSDDGMPPDQVLIFLEMLTFETLYYSANLFNYKKQTCSPEWL